VGTSAFSVPSPACHDSGVSKAFTKDDGPEAAPVLRRRPPLPEGTPNYVTARGLQALREELAELDDAAPGSSSASPDARAAWRSDLERRIATAVVTAPPAHDDEIRFGAFVRVRDAGGETRELQIVGVDEADASQGLVAFTAPLARSLLGGRAGDTVRVRTPRGEEDLEVLAVGYR
jgi:transcription elongation factor GreB